MLEHSLDVYPRELLNECMGPGSVLIGAVHSGRADSESESRQRTRIS